MNPPFNYKAAYNEAQERVKELEAQLADAKLPTVEHVQAVYKNDALTNKLEIAVEALNDIHQAPMWCSGPNETLVETGRIIKEALSTINGENK